MMQQASTTQQQASTPPPSSSPPSSLCLAHPQHRTNHRQELAQDALDVAAPATFLGERIQLGPNLAAQIALSLVLPSNHRKHVARELRLRDVDRWKLQHRKVAADALVPSVGHLIA